NCASRSACGQNSTPSSCWPMVGLVASAAAEGSAAPRHRAMANRQVRRFAGMSARDARQRSHDSNGRHPAQVVHARAAHGQLIAERAPKAWIDYTGVGRVVFNIFKRERVPHIMPATIISG